MGARDGAGYRRSRYDLRFRRVDWISLKFIPTDFVVIISVG